MKRVLLIAMLIAFLLACGCAQKGGPVATPTPTATPVANVTEAVGSLTQEDLDQLKSDLEDLEFEGPGGLSEE